MRPHRRRGVTIAEFCCIAGTAIIAFAFLVVLTLQAKHAADAASAEAAVSTLEDTVSAYIEKRGLPPKDLDGDGIVSTDEIVSQLKNWNLLPQEFVPYDPWGERYVIVLNSDAPLPGNAVRPFEDVLACHPLGRGIWYAGHDEARGSLIGASASLDGLGSPVVGLAAKTWASTAGNTEEEQAAPAAAGSDLPLTEPN